MRVDNGIRLERADGVVRRDVGGVVGRAEAGGAGGVEGVCELLAGGHFEEFADFGALRFTDGFVFVSFFGILRGGESCIDLPSQYQHVHSLYTSL